MKFEFQASAVHRQWKDKITFNIGNAPGFQRDTNAKMNAGIYVYDGESLTLNWQNWEPETLYRKSTSDKFVSKDNDFTITFGKHLSDLKLLGDDAHAQAVEETTAPASPAPAPPAPAPPAPPAPAPAEQAVEETDVPAPVPEPAVEETAPAPASDTQTAKKARQAAKKAANTAATEDPLSLMID